jgi:hypothetical protein
MPFLLASISNSIISKGNSRVKYLGLVFMSLVWRSKHKLGFFNFAG